MHEVVLYIYICIIIIIYMCTSWCYAVENEKVMVIYHLKSKGENYKPAFIIINKVEILLFIAFSFCWMHLISDINQNKHFIPLNCSFLGPTIINAKLRPQTSFFEKIKTKIILKNTNLMTYYNILDFFFKYIYPTTINLKLNNLYIYILTKPEGDSLHIYIYRIQA